MSNFRISHRILLLLCAVLVSSAMSVKTAEAQERIRQDQLNFFETKIRPALVKYCYECHSTDSGKTRGGLLVDTREGLLLGGDSGPAIEPGRANNSVLIDAIHWRDFEMPPRTKMPASVIADFEKWVNMGAPDPRAREKHVHTSKMDLEAGRKHWAFQPVRKSADKSIDDFVNAKLREKNLSANDKADPATLLRRLNFDIIGLPPSPAEINAFLSDWKRDSSAAISTKVDELLSRPQYGERWGRHWLDVARYAESTGKDVNVSFPHAWRYRDYVIDAFNADKPYDEFVREQIAGDLIPVDTDEDWQENLIATGFLAMGTKGLNERNPRQFRMDLVDEQIDTVTQSILGITVACARCHDHKFDPIPTTDYYALAGIFLSTNTYYGTFEATQNRRSSDLIILPIEDPDNPARSYSKEQIERMREQIADAQRETRELRSAAARSGGGSGQNLQRQLLQLRGRVQQFQGVLTTIDETGKAKTFAMGVQDADRKLNANVLVRGDVEKPAQEVDRGFLQVLDRIPAEDIPRNKSGRLELADWLTSTDNPLTARVMANRVWQSLFGKGIVTSPNNWGTTGQPPSHPELLDHLALEFMDGGWSVKSLIRNIVHSDAYQRSSEFARANNESDPDNNWLWRANSRQLDAESLRDSMLVAGGNLDTQRPHGSRVAQVGDARIGRQLNEQAVNAADNHRSVYLPIIRGMAPQALALFDFTDPVASIEKRDSTNVPSQSLYLMNSRFVMQQAELMARELVQQFEEPRDQVQHAFLKVYGRPATSDELTASITFFQRFRSVAGENSARGYEQARRQSGGLRRAFDALRGANNGGRFRGNENGRSRGRSNGANQAGQPRGQNQARRGQGQYSQNNFRRQLGGNNDRPGMGGSMNMAGGGGAMNGNFRQAGQFQRRNSPPPMRPLNARELTLAVFCQSLLASAEFRILN